jgi:membrane protease YdiL (CAAX protease family)
LSDAEAATAPRAGLYRVLGVAAAVTALATALSYLLPDAWAATGVGFAFLGTTYWLVVRSDDVERIRRYGLSLGGLLEPLPLSARRLTRDAAIAIAYALAAAAIIYPCFWLGFRTWWHVEHFRPAPLGPVINDALGQLLVIALPEEAFYRGYLQTSLERELGPRFSVSVFGTRLGLGVVLTSAIFALGHLLTELNPARLAVFFPALLFGFLRARTGGIGAALLFHAMCNLFAAYLLRSYGLSH